MSGSPGRVGGGSHAANVVREALRAVASETVATRVLHRALHLAGESEVPPGGAPLRRFVDRHLRLAAGFVLGDDLAETLVDQVAVLVTPLPSIGPAAPVKGLAPSGAATPLVAARKPTPSTGALELDTSSLDPPSPTGGRGLELVDEFRDPSRVHTRPTQPAPARTLVAFATTDRERGGVLAAHLGESAQVVVVDDVLMLLESVQLATPTSGLVVIVDGAQPSVHPPTLAMVSGDLPAGSTIVCWCVPAAVVDEAIAFGEVSAETWVPTALDADVEELARIVRGYLGAREEAALLSAGRSTRRAE